MLASAEGCNNNETEVSTRIDIQEGVVAMILDQQIVLHFGEEYDATLASVLKYTKTILNRPPLAAQKYRIFNCEGGGGNLSRLALSYIIEKDDVDDGLDAFSTYLDEEYSSSNNRAKTHHTKWVGLEDNLATASNVMAAEAALEPFRVPAAAPSGGLQPLRPHGVKQVLFNEEETELYTTLASLNYQPGIGRRGRQKSYGKLQEAFDLLGLSREDGQRIYRRVKARVDQLRGPG